MKSSLRFLVILGIFATLFWLAQVGRNDLGFHNAQMNLTEASVWTPPNEEEFTVEEEEPGYFQEELPPFFQEQMGKEFIGEDRVFRKKDVIPTGCQALDPSFLNQIEDEDYNCLRNIGSISITAHPRAGAYYLRHLLEQVSGVYTGSFLNIKTNAHEQFGGEQVFQNDKVIFVETAFPLDPRLLEVSIIIHLGRNPFDMIDEAYHGMKEINLSDVPPQQLWNEKVNQIIASWAKHATTWQYQTQPQLVITYEDLIWHCEEEMEKIFSLLITNPSLLQKFRERYYCACTLFQPLPLLPERGGKEVRGEGGGRGGRVERRREEEVRRVREEGKFVFCEFGFEDREGLVGCD